jgi:high-affinity Fe2+/Pb2+ permease
MPEIIFITVVIASMLFIGVAWILALRESRLTAAWIEQMGRRTFGPTPMVRGEERAVEGGTAQRR